MQHHCALMNHRHIPRAAGGININAIAVFVSHLNVPLIGDAHIPCGIFGININTMFGNGAGVGEWTCGIGHGADDSRAPVGDGGIPRATTHQDRHRPTVRAARANRATVIHRQFLAAAHGTDIHRIAADGVLQCATGVNGCACSVGQRKGTARPTGENGGHSMPAVAPCLYQSCIIHRHCACTAGSFNANGITAIGIIPLGQKRQPAWQTGGDCASRVVANHDIATRFVVVHLHIDASASCACGGDAAVFGGIGLTIFHRDFHRLLHHDNLHTVGIIMLALRIFVEVATGMNTPTALVENRDAFALIIATDNIYATAPCAAGFNETCVFQCHCGKSATDGNNHRFGQIVTHCVGLGANDAPAFIVNGHRSCCLTARR